MQHYLKAAVLSTSCLTMLISNSASAQYNAYASPQPLINGQQQGSAVPVYSYTPPQPRAYQPRGYAPSTHYEYVDPRYRYQVRRAANGTTSRLAATTPQVQYRAPTPSYASAPQAPAPTPQAPIAAHTQPTPPSYPQPSYTPPPTPQPSATSSALGYDQPTDYTYMPPEGTMGTPSSDYKNSESASSGSWLPEGMELKLGVAVAAFPKYHGSEETRFVGAPFIDLEYQERWFVSPFRGIGGYGYRDDSIDWGIRLGFDVGRDNDDIRYLNGTGEIDHAITLGTFINYKMPLPDRPASEFLMFSAEFDHDISGANDGLTFRIGSDYHFIATDNLRMSAGINATYANDDYLQTYFGINRQQSIASGIAEYNPQGSFRDMGVNMMGFYDLGDQWSLFGRAGYFMLLEDAKDSPIISIDGDDNQLTGALGVVYSF